MSGGEKSGGELSMVLNCLGVEMLGVEMSWCRNVRPPFPPRPKTDSNSFQPSHDDESRLLRYTLLLCVPFSHQGAWSY